MKGIIFSLAIIFLSAPVLADEQIKLAQVIGSGGAVAPASDTESASAAATETTASSATGSYVAVGILIAASIGVIAGTNSSSSH